MTSSALCSCYAATLSTVLVRSDSSVAINAVLLDVSRSLVKRIDSLWKAWKQAKYIEAVSNNASVDPATLRLLQRKCNPSPPVRGRRNPRSYIGSDVVMSPGSTPLGKRPSRTLSGFGANSNGLKQGKRRMSVWPRCSHWGNFRFPLLTLFSTQTVLRPSPQGQ